jgi:hypothetical protein
MGIFDRVFGTKEEKEYRLLLADVCGPLLHKIDAFDEREVRAFLTVILEASKQSMRQVLFKAPEELGLKRQITKEGIGFWLRKVCLALMSYSHYFYADSPEMRSNQEFAYLVEMSYKAYWQRMFESYNQLFNEKIGQEEIDYYAAGLKEDSEKEYSESGEMDKAFQLSTRDHLTIGSELLENIWKEKLTSSSKETLRDYRPGYGLKNVDPQAKKTLFMGASIWRAYQQTVQPFLEQLLDSY